MKNTYLSYKVYFIATAIILFMVATSSMGRLYLIGLLAFLLLFGIILYDFITLKIKLKYLSGYRTIHDKLSLGDHQEVIYHVKNEATKAMRFDMYDEFPVQLQIREAVGLDVMVGAQNSRTISYGIYPTERGVYNFGHLYGLFKNVLPGLIKIRVTLESEKEVVVYPSIMQMKRYALQIFSKTASFYGIRNIRTIGENDEFEHIRNYATGDNIKSINWKATSRKNELLVNQYQDSRSQMIYCIVDKGRAMEMPFNSLSLLDYSINTSLVLTNIALRKYDKAGLITFSHKMDDLIKAEANLNQLELINHALFKQATDFKESNFQLLYYTIRKTITRRSILFLFTNFEDYFDLEKNLPYIKSINDRHLLILISFVNSEVEKRATLDANNKEQIYSKTIAQKTINDKEHIMREIRNAGIQVILTKPEDLSISVINKYLEIKAKRMK
jgi:uncharacterized protein (DUF58 family)